MKRGRTFSGLSEYWVLMFFYLVVVQPAFADNVVDTTVSPFLSFPIPNRTPKCVIINSVFDHNMNTPYAAGGIRTVDYTGKEGREECGWDSTFFSQTGFRAFRKFDPLLSSCGGNFKILSDCGLCGDYTCDATYFDFNFLFYDNHPGYDFRTVDQNGDDGSGKIAVFAASAGTVKTTGAFCSINNLQTFNGVVIKHDPPFDKYATMYLHLSAPEVSDGMHITKGARIGLAGSTGLATGVHLHFEVCRDTGNGFYVSVDPYGWQGVGADPYDSLNPSFPHPINTSLWEPCTDAYEQNNFFAEAFTWNPSDTVVGKICNSTDDDYFKIDVGDTGVISLHLQVPPTTLNVYNLELYDPSRNFLVGAYNYNGEEDSINYYATAPGIYYVKIEGLGGNFNTSAPYSLFGTWPTALSVDFGCHPTGSFVTLNATVSGTATGPIRYSFFWNCNNPGRNIDDVMADCGNIPTPPSGDSASNAIGVRYNGITDTQKIVSHDYSSQFFVPFSSYDTFYAKVIVERGGAPPVERRIPIFVPTSVEDVGGQIPNDFSLSQNYPNPFNSSTQILFAIPKSGHVVLEIYNVLGQRVKSLVNEYLPAGNKSVAWDGKDDNGVSLPSGTYLYRLRTGNHTKVEKMTIIK